MLKKLSLLIIGTSVCLNCYSQLTQLSDQKLQAQFGSSGLVSLTCPTDLSQANVFERGGQIGSPIVKYKIAQGDWLDLYQSETEINKQAENNGKGIQYSDFIPGMPLKMVQSFSLENGILNYDIELQSMLDFPITIGDLGLRFPWKRPSGENPQVIFEQSFVKHHYISGNGSWLLFTKPSGEGPMLLVTLKPGTKLEYFTSDGGYTTYIHSGLSGNSEKNGSWRQKHTFLELGSAGSENERISYGFQFQWVDGYDQARDAIVSAGGFDIRVVPGMTLPTDLSAKIAIRTLNQIDSITCEYPDATILTKGKPDPGSKQEKTSIYNLSLHKLGENLLTIHYNNSQKTYLEFFCTEPIETLIKKRSNFIVTQQQHKNPEKWYDGLFSVWDMKNQVLRGPDNTDGYDHFWGYVLACDDPALCKAPYVAAKNEVFPDDSEIEALEYYLEHFVWGGLQRTDQEKPYPYGIYGTPNWMVCRDPVLRAGIKNRNLDKMNIWRSYDYPHMIMLYYHMYQIAKKYPDKVSYLDAEGYLRRAAETAKAYFIYPYEILPWYETYKWGCYNELVIVELIKELDEYPQTKEFLISEWEKKAKYFIYDDPYPFRSEYSLDRTAFESSYALAKYAYEQPMEPDTLLWYDKKLDRWYSHDKVNIADAKDFMERQLIAGLACRGWLETKYFLLGSDFTSSSDSHCLSYMAKMGGWGILDYGLSFADDPDDFLQLGYASYLSSWALMNTGTSESGYGYWFPGKINDGATGWAFMASKHGRAWIRKNEDRGAWRYDGEADLGYGAAIRTATTIITYDSLFGWIGYGGNLRLDKKEFQIIPRDGLRKRFDIITPNQKIHIELNRDGFLKEAPIIVSEDLKSIQFTLENYTDDVHETELLIHSNKGGKISVKTNNKEKYTNSTDQAFIKSIQVKENTLKVIIEFQ